MGYLIEGTGTAKSLRAAPRVARAMQDGALRTTAEGILVDVDVRPGASETRITGYVEARGSLRVDVAARPEKGAANRALAAFFARLGGPSAVVTIVRGATSRRKTLRVAGTTKAALLAAIARGMP